MKRTYSFESNKNKQEQPFFVGQLYRFELRTSQGNYSIETDSIADFDKRLEKI